MKLFPVSEPGHLVGIPSSERKSDGSDSKIPKLS